MANARTIIKGALRGLGRIGRGMDMTAAQASDGLEILNQLIASWSGESLVLPFRTTETLTYAVSKNEYTIGTGGDLNTARPIQILDAYHRLNSIDYAMDIMSFRRYADIGLKSISTFPTRLYFEPEYPLAKLHFDLMPATDLTLHLISMKALTSIANLDDTIVLPAEYDRALKFNLMLDLAPDYGMKVSQEIINAATESKANLKRIARANREEVLGVDSGLRSGNHYNIYSDGYY